MQTAHTRNFRRAGSMTVLCLLFAGCAHDVYEQRADMIKQHTAAFYDHLKADRVEAAIAENEAIEALAGHIGETITKRHQALGINDVDREWMSRKAAVETAAENWLALGKYLTAMKRYNQARAAYQRVIDTYTGETEHSYRERAFRSQRDIDILSPPTAARQ